MASELIPIRLSHLIGHSGVGAIVRGPNELVVIHDVREWTNRQGSPAGKAIPYVERVRNALRIDQTLREPPVAKVLGDGTVAGACVPATRFPSWVRCSVCGTLYRWLSGRDPSRNPLRCTSEECRRPSSLEQVTWVLVDAEGYLADVPWHFLAHNEARDPTHSNCRRQDQLRLIERGYEDRMLQCGACRAQARFRGDERLGFGQGRMQPWTRNELTPPRESAKEGDTDLAQVLAVTDTRAYAPVADSVLVIPPESRIRKGTVVDRLYRDATARARIEQARTNLARRSALRVLASDYRCSPDDIEAALSDLAGGYPLYGETFTPGQLRESEFKAFLDVPPDQRDDEELVTRDNSNQWRNLNVVETLDSDASRVIPTISRLIRVDRLKAVKVFKGFTRLGGETIVPPDITGQSSWLPAIELYGEGIFFVLDQDRISAWEQQQAVVSRLNRLIPRFAQSGFEAPNPLTARFLLLHTLSHLLMRQIESEGGYPAASLIERIYCSDAPVPMAAILIHVAVPDVAGSLGGLAELSEPRRFLRILIRALERSRWCSLDPVCSEHEGQGPGLLNRAACHACALVPEPACEYGNSLLDRGFVKGNAGNGLPSFFGDM